MYLELIVSNVGTVYGGGNKPLALAKYEAYVGISKSGVGRAGNEDVTLFEDDEIIKEHKGEN